MTIVVGVTDGFVVVAIVVHIAAQMFGTSFFTSSQQSAASHFGGRSENYLDQSVNKSRVNLKDDHEDSPKKDDKKKDDDKDKDKFYKAPK